MGPWQARYVRVAALVLLLTAACAPGPSSAPVQAGLPVPPGAQTATVVRQVDGDTLVLRGRGTGPLPAEPTRVRVLLVDTPEVAGEPECLGERAAERTAALVPDGSAVRVEADRDRLDRYGRTLLHVWNADGVELGQALLREGLATVLVVRPNVRYLEAYRAAEREAEQAGRGLWSACS